MPRVSVLVPIYNGEKYLKETLESILSQDADLEILVIDDGSTDDSVKVARSIKDKRIRYFAQSNSGSPARPRNKGLKEARGDFIAFCDQDDIWYPGKLEKQLAAYDAAKNKEDIGIIVSSADIVDGTGKRIRENKLEPGIIKSREAFEKLLVGNFITTCTSIIPKYVFRKIGLLDERLVGVDDYDFWLRITQEYSVLVVGETLAGWRIGETLGANKAALYTQNEKIFEKLEKNNPDNLVKIGHGKNLMRIIAANILQENYTETQKYINKACLYPVSKKGEYIIKTYKFSKPFALYFLRFLQFFGKVSL